MSLRGKLIRLASTMGQGSSERRAVLRLLAVATVPKHFRSRTELRRFLQSQLPGYTFRTRIVGFEGFGYGSSMFISVYAADGTKVTGGNVIPREWRDRYSEVFDLIAAWPRRPAPTIDDKGETYKVLF